MKKKLLLIKEEEEPGGGGRRQRPEVDGGEEEEEEAEQPLKEKVWRETKKLWIVAGPAIFTRVSTFGIYIISLPFIGHIGSTDLAAFALVITVLLRFATGFLVISYPYIYIFYFSLLGRFGNFGRRTGPTQVRFCQAKNIAAQSGQITL